MIKLFEFLITGCWHEWETIKEQHLVDETKYHNGVVDKKNYDRYTLRCKKCGHIKYIDV